MTQGLGIQMLNNIWESATSSIINKIQIKKLRCHFFPLNVQKLFKMTILLELKG